MSVGRGLDAVIANMIYANKSKVLFTFKLSVPILYSNKYHKIKAKILNFPLISYSCFDLKPECLQCTANMNELALPF